ncbi:hypothetical protein DBZ45_11670 [Arthrobacter globiformis]|uniref:Uncharacterized protein n=1 Tax=Arthrobacter globiformis TaxID=1665 RepID=A0A328HG16_ARTGO|nr:hypothetical protein DBZ45_11670 [Arthrobacter globiformis]
MHLFLRLVELGPRPLVEPVETRDFAPHQPPKLASSLRESGRRGPRLNHRSRINDDGAAHRTFTVRVERRRRPRLILRSCGPGWPA